MVRPRMVGKVGFGAGRAIPGATAEWPRRVECGRLGDLDRPGLLRYRRPKTTVPGWRERLLCCKCGSREVDIVVTGTERAAGLFGRSPMSTGDIDSLVDESGFELGVPPSFSPLARQSERRSRSVRRRTRPLVRRDQRFESAFLPRRVKRTRTPSRGLHSAVTSES